MRIFRKPMPNGKPSPTWWFRVRVGGRVVQRSTGETAQRQAKTVARREVAEIRRQFADLPRQPASPAPAPTPATASTPAAEPATAPAPPTENNHQQLPGFTAPAPDSKARPLTAEQRKVADALTAAHAGQIPWLEDAIRRAGYQRTDAPTSVVTMQQLSELAGVTKPTLWNWVTHGLPRATSPDGVATVDLRRAVPWLLGYYQKAVKEARADATAAAGKPRERAAGAKAEMIEIELAEKRGQMVRTEDHWRCFFAWIEAYVGAFRTKPAAWAQACAGEPAVRIRELIERDLDQIFASLQQMEIPANIPPAAEEHVRAAIRAIAPTRAPAKAPERPKEPAHVEPSTIAPADPHA